MDSCRVVGVDRGVHSFCKLTDIRKSIKLESQIRLEVVEERLLIAVLPR